MAAAGIAQRAEAEAERKGLTGEAKRAYVGGVWQHVKAAHARATAPGKGAAHLNRKRRVSADLDRMRKEKDKADAALNRARNRGESTDRVQKLHTKAMDIGNRYNNAVLEAEKPAKKKAAKKPKLVFGVSTVPPEKPPRRNAEGFTPRQQEIIDEINKWKAEARVSGRQAHRSLARDAELKLLHLNKEAFQRWQEQEFAHEREHERAYTADRKKLEAFNDNSLLVRARTDAQARAKLEATRKQLAERDKKLSEDIDALVEGMNKRAKAQREAQRRGDTATADRLRKEINNIDEVGIEPLRRERHAVQVRRDNLLDSGYLKH